MITESGRVIAIESNGLWVETANQSACGRCSARKGCGQSLLAQMGGHRSYVRAAFNGFVAEEFAEGDTIVIGIHETAVLRASLLVYSLPLLGLVAGAALAHGAHLPEAAVALMAVAGLALSALGVSRFARRFNNDDRFEPVVVHPASHLLVPVFDNQR